MVSRAANRNVRGRTSEDTGASLGGVEKPAFAAGHNAFGPDTVLLNDQRAPIRVVPGELFRVVDEAEAALIAAGRPIFTRAGKLVRPIVEKVPAAKGRWTNMVLLKEIGAEALLDQMSQVANFMKPSGRGAEANWIATDPADRIVEILRKREGSWHFPPISGVINTPTLRHDGTLLQKPGYDLETRLFLDLAADFQMPPISEHPSRADAVAALELLKSVLSEFPFVDDKSRAVALSGFLTPILRPSMLVVPMHLVRASTPSTGKSYYVDLASAICSGRRMPVIAAGSSTEETEKRLGSLILAGCPLISIDNLEHDLGGSTLCQATERPIVQVRILGRSEMPECESRTTFFATGNNVNILDDMVRRTILCQMATDLERPELRKFSGEPFDTILGDRGKFVGAALTIVKAYIAAGRPQVCESLASFEDWANMVRSPLVWLGEADPVATMEVLRKHDPFLQNVTELFREVELHKHVLCNKDGIFTAAKLIEVGEEGFESKARPDLYNLLMRVAGSGARISPVRLGIWLGRISGRVVGGRRLLKWEDAKASNRYWIEVVSGIAT